MLTVMDGLGKMDRTCGANKCISMIEHVWECFYFSEVRGVGVGRGGGGEESFVSSSQFCQPFKDLAKVLFYPVFFDLQKERCFLEGSRISPVCRFGQTDMKMKSRGGGNCYLQRNLPKALFTEDLTWISLRMNPGLRDESL
jgi:hypothetical protein